MATAVAMWTNPVNSRASSAEARYVASRYDSYWRPLHRSYSIGIGGAGLYEHFTPAREPFAGRKSQAVSHSIYMRLLATDTKADIAGMVASITESELDVLSEELQTTSLR